VNGSERDQLHDVVKRDDTGWENRADERPHIEGQCPVQRVGRDGRALAPDGDSAAAGARQPLRGS
jgi:hypothetical protein